MPRIKDTQMGTTLCEAFIDQFVVFCGILKMTLQCLLEGETTQHLNTHPLERTEERRGYRNGYRER